MKTTINLLLKVLFIIISFFLLVGLITIIIAEIDAEKRCKGLTLKECYNHCEAQTYLIGQDCLKIIKDLKETREILGEVVE